PSIGGSNTTRHRTFKLEGAPSKDESAQPSRNPSMTELMEVYAAKRRKDNAGKSVEVEEPFEENAEVEKNGNLKRKPVKKRKTKLVDHQIITNIQPYSVMMDLQNKKVDITYAQLFQAAPNVRREVLKVLRPGRNVKAKFAEFCLNQNDELYTTSMYCEARVNSEPIVLVLDSGSSGCVVSARFLKKVRIRIDRSSTVMMVGVHGEQKRPIGEIDRFPIT
ncbi:15899_t:CDS:1, partial [Cetraspora pellucida]